MKALSIRSLLWFSCAFAALLFEGQESWAGGESKLCSYQFRQKLYDRAARCFRSLAEARLKKGGLSGEQKAKVGALLRNSSLALRKAAASAKDPLHADYLREQALEAVALLLRRKLYEEDSQKRLAEHIREKILLKIKYTSVTIVTPDPKAEIRLTGGYKFAPRQKIGAQWSLKLRKGSYSVLVKVAQGPIQTRTLELDGKQRNVLLRFAASGTQAPLKKPKPASGGGLRVLSWVLVGGGAALAIAGGALVGAALGAKESANQLAQELQTQNQSPNQVTVTQTRTLRDAINATNSQLVAGGCLGSAGLAAAVVGLILYATAPKKARPAPPQSRAKSALLRAF